REDALGLFGFLSPEELTFFKLLLSVKGIGPKAGLGILSRAELRVLKRAVLQDDAALLATVPGIGPKTAGRVRRRCRRQSPRGADRPGLHARGGKGGRPAGEHRQRRQPLGRATRDR